MPQKKEHFPDTRRLEDKYFHKKEQELIRKLKERAAKEASRKELSETLNISDEGILHALEELGFNRETVKVLHLFPLIAVAWADGSVSQKEREKILAAAAAHGIGKETAAYGKLQEWLENRPDEITVSRTLRIMRDLMRFNPGAKPRQSAEDILALCEQVADASGGILGMVGRVSREERAVLRQVADELAAAHRRAAQDLLKNRESDWGANPE